MRYVEGSRSPRTAPKCKRDTTSSTEAVAHLTKSMMIDEVHEMHFLHYAKLDHITNTGWLSEPVLHFEVPN